MSNTRYRRYFAWAVLMAVLGLAPHPQWLSIQAAQQDSVLIELSLEELMEVEVTSASRKPQRAGDVAAAVFVINQEDIRRSGATSLPEVLRMAPGIEVGRIDGNKWAVTSRGFNGRFANKLLVLLDGRSVYTRLFSGVFWDTLDVDLVDIDRIEVVRGPGAAVWGANAVNGVINIITKPAAETQGATATARFGVEERGAGSFRYGGEFAEGQGHYRVQGKYSHRDGGISAFSGQPAADSWDSSRGGFRLDYSPSSTNRFTVHASAYDGNSGETVLTRSLGSILPTPVNTDQQSAGGNVQARWERTSGPGRVSLQGYLTRTDRETVLFEETRTTADVEFQQQLPVGSRHDLVWGLGYRSTRDDTGSSFSITIDPTSANDHLVSSYVQDEISLVPDHVQLTVGARLDHTNYSGLEFQPNVRLVWKPNERQSLWGAVSRAARTPSRGDRSARLLGLIDEVVDSGQLGLLGPFSNVPLLTLFVGNDQMGSEHVSSFEVGYRAQPQDSLGIDIAAFYSDYGDLRSVTPGAPICEPVGVSMAQNPFCAFSAQYLALPVMFGNNGDAKLYGFEAAADWRGVDWLRVEPAYSYLGQRSEDLAPNLGSLASLSTGLSPTHQFSLRTGADVGQSLQLDGWLRYVGELESSGIPEYTTLDLRLAWQVLPNLEVSIVGQNLLEASHAEFVSELGDLPMVELQRSAHVQLRWGR